MPNGMYGGARGRKTKVGRKRLRFPPTWLPLECSFLVSVFWAFCLGYFKYVWYICVEK